MPLLRLIVHSVSGAGAQSVRVVTQTLFKDFEILTQVVGTGIEIRTALSQTLTIGFKRLNSLFILGFR